MIEPTFRKKGKLKLWTFVVPLILTIGKGGKFWLEPRLYFHLTFNRIRIHLSANGGGLGINDFCYKGPNGRRQGLKNIKKAFLL
jgi:hypothetical protein